MDKMRVLHVEDDPVDQRAIRRRLEEAISSINVTNASTFEQAQKMVAATTFALALLDYKLPDGTGLELIPKLGDIPAIIITGAGDERLAVRALKAGAQDYLVKDVQRGFLALLPEIVTRMVLLKEERRRLRARGDEAGDTILRLKEMLAVCGECERVRGVDGWWRSFIDLVSGYGETMVTYSLCGECAEAFREREGLGADAGAIGHDAPSGSGPDATKP